MIFKDGRLSVDFQGRSLEDLASEIPDKLRVSVSLDAVAVKQSLAISFRALPLDEGLWQIFKNNDAFFF